MAWYWILLIVVASILGLLFVLVVTAGGWWDQIIGAVAFLWYLGWFVAFVVIGGLWLLQVAVESSRPLAVTAAYLGALGALLAAAGAKAAATGRPSAKGPLGLLLLAGALGCVSADLAREGRPVEIALWLPLIALGAYGGVLVALSVIGSGAWRVRAGRVVAGLIVAAPALSVAGALRVSPW